MGVPILLPVPLSQACWDQFIRPTVSKDAHGYIIIIRINDLKVQLHHIRARTLSNPMNHRLRNGVVIGLHLRTESTPVQIIPRYKISVLEPEGYLNT